MSELDGPEIEMDRGFKIQQQRGGIWAAYAPQGSGSGYYSTEKKGHWYAAGDRAAAESMVRVWIYYQDVDWSDPAWNE